MSETTLKSVLKPQDCNEEEIIDIDSENSVVINIEGTNQESRTQETKDGSNKDRTCPKKTKKRGKEYKEYYRKTQKKELDTGFRPGNRGTWVYYTIADAATNQVPPTGTPLEYDPESRNSFVRLVFCIVLIMLIFTCAFNAFVFNVEFISDIFEDRTYNLFLLIGATLVTFIMHYVMFCSQCSRSAPCNFICLFIVAVAMSTVVACISIRYKMTVIAMSMGITTIVSLVCLALACTSFDFTKFMLYFIVISTALTLVGALIIILMYVFKWDIKPLHIGILVVFVVLCAIGMVMQLQMILGGRTVELGEEDYAMGAYMLYVSIIEMFLLILRIIGLSGDD